MSENVVSFGEAKAATQLTPELRHALKVLEAADAARSDSLFNQWEESFITSSLVALRKYKGKWELSDNRRDVIEKLEKKLEKEGLL